MIGKIREHSKSDLKCPCLVELDIDEASTKTGNGHGLCSCARFVLGLMAGGR